jgi:hypothetical protein
MNRSMVLVLSSTALALFASLVACTEYTPTVDNFGGGHHQPNDLEPPDVLDEFIQRAAVSSDILFVVDDSCSMGDNQQTLINNFAYFSQFIVDSGIDYHIAVVRGDLSQNTPGAFVAPAGAPPFITPDNVADPEASFVGRIGALGSAGTGTCESAYDGAYAALSPPMVNGPNDGFLREDAVLTVIHISDEEEQSCNPGLDPSEYVVWLMGLKNFDADLLNFGVIAGYDTATNRIPTACAGAYDPAVNYHAGVTTYEAQTGRSAITWSICNPDWSQVMTELGLAAAGLTRQFNLSRVPAFPDHSDFDGDGILEEPVLEIELDCGEGPSKIQPVWQDANGAHAWDYDRAQNAVLFSLETLPEESCQLRAIYPTGASL